MHDDQTLVAAERGDFLTAFGSDTVYGCLVPLNGQFYLVALEDHDGRTIGGIGIMARVTANGRAALGFGSDREFFEFCRAVRNTPSLSLSGVFTLTKQSEETVVDDAVHIRRATAEEVEAAYQSFTRNTVASLRRLGILARTAPEPEEMPSPRF